MKLLLKRQQTAGRTGQVKFKLWAKIDIDDEERALVSRYKFDQAILIDETNPDIRRNATFVGLFSGALICWLSFMASGLDLAMMLTPVSALAAGYWYYNEKRERLLVRDLLHGRNFICPSIIDLMKKEAEISSISGLFRQVMEGAKNWGGEEAQNIPALSKDEVRDLILRAF